MRVKIFMGTDTIEARVIDFKEALNHIEILG